MLSISFRKQSALSWPVYAQCDHYMSVAKDYPDATHVVHLKVSPRMAVPMVDIPRLITHTPMPLIVADHWSKNPATEGKSYLIKEADINKAIAALKKNEASPLKFIKVNT